MKTTAAAAILASLVVGATYAIAQVSVSPDKYTGNQTVNIDSDSDKSSEQKTISGDSAIEASDTTAVQQSGEETTLDPNIVITGSSYESEHAYINKIHVGPDGYLYLHVPGEFPIEHGCSGGAVRSQNRVSDDRTKAWMQMAFTSFVAKKHVFVWTEGCTVSGYPVMTQLQLQQ